MLSALSIAVQASLILFVSGYLFAYLLRKQEALWVRQRLLPIMIGFFVLAMVVPSKWVVYAALVGVIPLMARNRGDIPPLYLVAVLSMPTLTTPIALGSIYLLDIDKWLATALGAAIAFFKLPARDERGMGTRLDIAMILFLLLEAVQARGNNFTSILRIETNIVLSYMLPYFVLSRSISRPEDMRRLLLAMGFVAFTLSGVALYEARRSLLLYNMISQRLGIFELVSSYTHQRGGSLRSTASFFEATSFGAFLSTAFLGLLPVKEGFKSKKLRVIAFGGILLGIYAANTRAAVLGLIIGLLTYDFFRKDYRGLSRNIFLIGAVVASAYTAAQFSSKMAARIGLAGDSVGTADYRQRLLTRGWEEIKKHPITGVNPTQAYASLADLKQGEGIVDFVNSYIWYGLTAGIPGMIALLLGFLLSPFRLLGIRRRLSRIPLGRDVGAAIIAVSIFYAVSAGTSGFGGRSGMIFYMFLAIGAALCAMRPPRPAQERHTTIAG